VRAGYLALAERDGLPIVHTQRGTVEEVAARVLGLLVHGRLEQPADAASPWWKVEPELSFAEAVATLPIELQLYFTRELPLGRPIRAALLEHEPELAIWASGPEDPLLELASRSHPVLVLARLGASPRADALRRQLAAAHPVEVARSLVGIAGAEADALREQLAERAPGAVVESLLGRGDALAEALRERRWPAADTRERALSLRGLDDERAWRRRAALLDEDPAITLPSLVSLASARVDPVLDRWLAHAPKSVARALAGRRDATAHALRIELLEREGLGAEVLDSISGQDDSGSWALRERCVERWPSAVVGSLAGLPTSSRGSAMIEQCRSLAPGDMFLARRLVSA
jgi:hypothetical protein